MNQFGHKSRDEQDNLFDSSTEMWNSVLSRYGNDRSAFYAKGMAYWEAQPSNNNGVLAGLSKIHRQDVIQSLAFAKELLRISYPDLAHSKFELAADMAAGIGRVTENVLMNVCNEIDIYEPQAKFLDAAVAKLSGKSIGRFFKAGLHNFEPNERIYDLIWIQWGTGQLIDDDLVHFLKMVGKCIRPNGFLVIKDNVSDNEYSFLDKSDMIFTRNHDLLHDLIKEAGLKIVSQRKQTKYPMNLIPLWMYALGPVI